MATTITTTSAITLYPTGITNQSSTLSFSGSYPATRGYHTIDTNTSSYALAYVTTANTDASVDWTFDTSEIPANATITSVAVQTRARTASTRATATITFQMYSGANTAKGSSTSTTSTATATFTLSPGS